MAYDEHLASRIERVLIERKANFLSKKMFGGICYMVEDKMCVGIVKDQVMARVGPDAQPSALEKPNVTPMEFTGRPMKGYIYVTPEGVDREQDLEYWVDQCLAFNPLAKSSKKKTKKKKA
jgi:TfoX/Sxy family transcriptional regulator of competence genes